MSTFTITSSSYTVTLNKPIYGGEEGGISKEVELFDFWSDHFDTNDRGIANRPFTLIGVEYVDEDNPVPGMCFPLCFPLCFTSINFNEISDKFETIWNIQNNHEEVVISGLGNCIDGRYIIANFHFETVTNTINALSWSISLELIKEV